MIIRGVLDSSLNGQLCFRGFAPIKQLAHISKADYSYQRNPIDEQEEEIRDFLEEETYLFFPEIILSYKVKHSFDKGSKTTPLQSIGEGKKYTSGVDNTKLSIKQIDYKSSYDSRGISLIKIIELDLDNAELERMIAENNHPFHRIDGNHRLKAAEFSTSSKVEKMVAPFCILLGEEFYQDNVLQDNRETKVFDKSVKVFFHNINTKTVSLTSEENLRVMIDDPDNFPDSDLETILGPYAVKTRELIAKVNPEIFTGIEHILSKQYRTYYNDVFKRLLAHADDPETVVEKVFESLKAIDILYSENDSLKANSSFGLLTSFLYYHVQGNKAKFNFFKDWIMHNHIFEVEEIKAESLIKIFNKISARNIQVFVAMPYYEGDPDIIASYNQAYYRVIEKVKQNYNHVSINLMPIMEYTGKTRDIIENMIAEIKDCSIFVADITKGNPNVGYELGIARALNKPTIIVRQVNDAVAVPFDYEHDVRNTYNPQAIGTLEEIAYDNIVAILRDDYGLIKNAADV